MWRALRTASIGLLLPSLAHAHLAPPRVRADRAITIDTSRGTLLYEIRLSGNELRRVRAMGDADADGALSHAEVEVLLGQWTEALSRTVRYGETDLEPLSHAKLLVREANRLEGATADVDPFAANAARIAWRFDLKLERTGALTIHDAASFLPFDHTDATVIGPMTGLGDDPQRLGTEPRIGWVDATPIEHRIEIRYPAPPRRKAWPFALAIAVLAIVVLTRAVRSRSTS